jgi:acetoin utilization deacetylase AcuC-like enzyme
MPLFRWSLSDSTVHIYYSDHFEIPLLPGHRFPIEKYALLRQRLLSEKIAAEHELFASIPAEFETLLVAHDQQYLEHCFRGTLSTEAIARIGFPWSEQLLLRSRASVGGTLAAAECALIDGFAGNLAGGTHHAHADFGSGYCVFNDLAVAALTLLERKRIQRVLIIDLDVHQGDGTASIFKNDSRVFTFSMHGEKNFPFRKQVSSCDVNLPDGCTDAVYLELLTEHLPQIFEASDPQLILYQAGVDALFSDTLGRLRLSFDGLRRRDHEVFSMAKRKGVALAMTLGGGYANPIEHSIGAHVNSYAEAACIFH